MVLVVLVSRGLIHILCKPRATDRYFFQGFDDAAPAPWLAMFGAVVELVMVRQVSDVIAPGVFAFPKLCMKCVIAVLPDSLVVLRYMR